MLTTAKQKICITSPVSNSDIWHMCHRLKKNYALWKQKYEIWVSKQDNGKLSAVECVPCKNVCSVSVMLHVECILFSESELQKCHLQYYEWSVQYMCLCSCDVTSYWSLCVTGISIVPVLWVKPHIDAHILLIFTWVCVVPHRISNLTLSRHFNIELDLWLLKF